ncbi:SARP family transcriptional regulator [Actinoplanes friuliensis DSM 7358]|uniref:SARP family transcriptional regulator n=1 Tax=Actinoplanes friuliensis DSM 7358 TaxID=1246995 RepID=U5VZC4_9ACTN|nr:SARP family transcriptional regulator [Actinoplanes friuliensis DSM 7358]
MGPVEVRAPDGSVLAGEPRRLAVLAALAVDAGRVVQATTLIDRVWGDDPPGQAARTLGTYVTRIRRMLEQSGDSSVTVVSQAGGYRLTAGHDQVDLFRFRDLVVGARAPSITPERRVELLRQSVSLHRGDPLTGVSGAWATRTREQLAGELLTARAEWAEAELAVGNTTVVLAPLTALVDANPLVEPLVVTLVRALVAAGRPTEALERCRLHQQRLADGYGTDPSPQLKALYESVLRGDQRPAAVAERSQVPAAVAVLEPERPLPAPAVPSRRRRRYVMAAVGVCATLAGALGAVVVSRPPDRITETRFTVTEDFSGTALTPMQWAANQAERENGSSWSPGAVRVGGGEVQISGTGRNPTGAGNVGGAVCWCLDGGIVRTYGVWEVRARFDVGTGYAPALGLYSGVDEDTPGWGFMTMGRFDDGERRVMYPVVRGAGAEPVDGSPVAGDFTDWNTFSIEWRADFVAISLNGVVVLDTRKLPGPVSIPTVPMFLYVQIIPGPEGPVPAPNQETPSRVAAHVDWARYTS